MENMNSFVKANLLDGGVNNARTENGAVSYGTAGTALLDQFAHAGTARGRDIQTVWTEQATLWGENPTMALRFPFYLRMITRQTNIINGSKTEKVQRGQGAKDEAFKRFLWIARYHADEFYRNLWLVPVVGSWKDLWVLLSMDDTLNKEKFFDVIALGINDLNSKDLVKKYLPRIRTNKACTTDWSKKTNALAKDFIMYVGWTPKEYRLFKSTGKAHEFQRLICARDYSKINWNTIPGKALLSLATGKFLGNHNLTENYLNWLKNQPVAKFNGYPFELSMKLPKYSGYSKISEITKYTIDKQFAGLIETASKDGGAIKGNVLCALDTSGSMACSINGGPVGLTSFDVCVSLGIYFSELNKGAFHNVVAMFDNISKLKTLKGDSFTDKWYQIVNDNVAWGSTNYQSLIELICDTRQRHPEMPLEDFPQTLLVVSDMQFNPTISYYGKSISNYEKMMEMLRKYFPSEWVDDFKVVWWYCAGRDGASKDVPATMEHGGQYLVSGFDGSIISLILNGEVKIDPNTGKKVQPSMEDVVNEALTQEVLLFVQ